MGINDISYEDMRKEYIASLEALPRKRTSHDGYLAIKELECINKTYNEYKGLLNSLLIENDLNDSNLDEALDSLMDYASLVSNKLIDGFYDYSYLDEDNYSFKSYDEIIKPILDLHFEANSKDGKLYKLSRLNRLVLELSRKLYSDQNLALVAKEYREKIKSILD